MKFEITIYRDPWLDNGLDNLSRILQMLKEEMELFGENHFQFEIYKDKLSFEIYDFEKFTDDLARQLIYMRNNYLLVEEKEDTGEKKEIKKDFIVLQENKKIGGKINFKDRLFNPEETKRTIKEILKLSYKDGKNRCVLCGRSFDKSFKNLQMAAYPLVTKIKSLSGVRTYKDGVSYAFKDYYTSLCPLCYLVGVCEWTDGGIIYRTFVGDKSYLFLPQKSNLVELKSFKDRYIKLLNESSRWSNIKVNIKRDETENTPGKFSTLLCFYEKMVVDASLDPTTAPHWSLIEVPYGTVKNIKHLEIGVKESILMLIKEFKEHENESLGIYSDIIKQIYFFLDKPTRSGFDNNKTQEIREKLSEAIINDNFRDFARNFLPEKRGKIGFSNEVRKSLEDLIYLWRWRKMGIPKEKLSTIKSVGNIVAKVSKNNLSLLYKLDKSRNLAEFWTVLREISRKLLSLEDKDRKMIKPTSLEELINLVKEYEELWKEIRDLLVVYSCMFYSIGSEKDKDLKTQRGEER